MNKNLLCFKVFFIVIISLCLIFCNGKTSKSGLPENVKEIKPEGSVFPGKKNNSEYKDITVPGEQNIKPKVTVKSNETLIKTLEVNLDLDRDEEQILILKDKNNADSIISIAIVDFDSVINRYRRTWQGETYATNIRSFNVFLDDIIGDHNLDIICSGINIYGEQTLNIFWKNKSRNEVGLFYSPICSIKVNGTIEIKRESRSLAYKSGLKDGISFPIIAKSQDQESENIMDLIKSIYYWNFKTKKYIKIQEEKIPGKKIEETQLTDIFRKGVEEFKDHINGPWYKSTGKGSLEDQNPDIIILFEPEKEKATFFSGNIQESYIWDDYYKRLGNILYIKGVNELISYMENEIYIKIISLKTMEITVRDIDSHTRKKTLNEKWTGKYIKLTENMQNSEIDKSNHKSGEEVSLPDLSGLYLSDTGKELDFKAPKYNLKDEDSELNGGYSLFFIDCMILELKILSKTGIVTDTKTYKLEFHEELHEREIIRRIILTPGSIYIYGFNPDGNEIMRFEQIETIDTES